MEQEAEEGQVLAKITVVRLAHYTQEVAMSKGEYGRIKSAIQRGGDDAKEAGKALDLMVSRDQWSHDIFFSANLEEIEGNPIIEGILSRLPKGCTGVLASTQYGMGFILTEQNEIVFRDDSLSHAGRKVLAKKVNAVLNPPRQI